MSSSLSGAIGSYKLINYIFAGIIICIFIYSGIFSSEKNSYPVHCIHEQITGISCPSCGMSRSFSCVVRGDFKEAAEWNAYGPRVFLFFFFQLLLRVSNIIVLKRKPSLIRQLTIYDISLSIISVVLGFWQFVVYYIRISSIAL